MSAATWSPRQRRLLAAMGHTPWVALGASRPQASGAEAQQGGAWQGAPDAEMALDLADPLLVAMSRVAGVAGDAGLHWWHALQLPPPQLLRAEVAAKRQAWRSIRRWRRQARSQ